MVINLKVFAFLSIFGVIIIIFFLMSNAGWFFKKHQISKGNLQITVSWLKTTEMVCGRFLDSNFNEAVIDKMSIFPEIAPNLKPMDPFCPINSL